MAVYVVVVLSIYVILFVCNSRSGVTEGMMPVAAEGTTGNNLIPYAVIRVWNFRGAGSTMNVMSLFRAHERSPNTIFKPNVHPVAQRRYRRTNRGPTAPVSTAAPPLPSSLHGRPGRRPRGAEAAPGGRVRGPPAAGGGSVPPAAPLRGCGAARPG